MITDTLPYIGEDFLLGSERACRLYHEVAASLPIVDFHNHLSPRQIAEDTTARDLAELWVESDAYKHRAMRINGIPEDGITGSAEPYEKYLHWVDTLPRTVGNCLHQWSYLELDRVFGISEPLTRANARAVWDHCNAHLANGSVSPRRLLRKFNVEALCTSDDLLDDVGIHAAASDAKLSVRPSLRTDSIAAETLQNARAWTRRLGEATDIAIETLDTFETAISQRVEAFVQVGCRLADQALDAGFDFVPTERKRARELFAALLDSQTLDAVSRTQWRSYVLAFVAERCWAHGWTLQLHVGAQRDTSTALRQRAGSAGGYAAFGEGTDIRRLTLLFDTLDRAGHLPRVLLYNLNPTDNAAFATLTGSFSADGVASKIQFGPAWWYNDHYDGIMAQLSAQANYSLLSHFIGMTTDSRTFLSFSRHEYFRRVLCQWLAVRIHRGLIPDDDALLTETITAICYGNARRRILQTETHEASR